MEVLTLVWREAGGREAGAEEKASGDGRFGSLPPGIVWDRVVVCLGLPSFPVTSKWGGWLLVVTKTEATQQKTCGN